MRIRGGLECPVCHRSKTNKRSRDVENKLFDERTLRAHILRSHGRRFV